MISNSQMSANFKKISEIIKKSKNKNKYKTKQRLYIKGQELSKELAYMFYLMNMPKKRKRYQSKKFTCLEKKLQIKFIKKASECFKILENPQYVFSNFFFICMFLVITKFSL